MARRSQERIPEPSINNESDYGEMMLLIILFLVA